MKHRLLQNNRFSIPATDWNTISQKCKGRSGVYGFINNVNGNCYIGSSTELYNRIRKYNQPWYQNSRSNTLMVKAILKYGLENITLVIIEYTAPENAVSTEQQYIDLYKPEYNILLVATSSLGYQHTELNKNKISKAMLGKERSLKVREDMAKRQKGASNTFFGKSHTEQAKALQRASALARVVDHNPGLIVTVLDNTTNITTTYKSLRQAAKLLKSTHITLAKYNNKLFRGKYFISIEKG